MSLSKNIIKIVVLCIAPTMLVACGGGSSSTTTPPPPDIIPLPPVPDSTPDSFSFNAVDNAQTGTDITSNIITVNGIDTDTVISINGGSYSIDSADFTDVDGTVVNGQKIQLQLTAPENDGEMVNAVLTIGSISATFSVTTPAIPLPDTTPDSFSFNAVDNIQPDTVIQSNSITISGIEIDTAISISGGLYAIDAGNFTELDGTVINGQEIQVQVTASENSEETVSAVLTIGSVSATFSVTTIMRDPLLFEAEESTLVGNVMLSDNVEASNGQLVSDFLTGSDGILILDSPESIAFKLTYSSTSTVDLNVQINQTLLKPILTSTENVLTSTLIEADVSAGDRITITTEEGNDNFQLDSLTFIESPLQQVSTLANAGFGGGDGISVSPDGDVYVSSGGSATEGPGLRIEKISKAGEVSTFTTGFVSANGSDFDSMGNLYVADYEANVVRKVDTEGNVTTFASNLDGPAGVYVDQQDNVIVGLYGANFSGQANTVLSITPEGNSSILATGSGLINIIGVAGDENGVIYAGSWDTGRIFKITDGEVELLADTPVNVNQITYSRGYVYVFGGGRILRISTSGDNIGNIEVFSGSSNNSSTVNGIVADAEYNNPNAGSFSDNGNILYVYDSATGDVRKITFDDNVLENFGETVIVKDFSTVSTVANIGFSGSDGIAVAANGNVYISGGGGRGNVTLITPDGTVSVFDTGYQYAIGGEVDSNDNLYIADWGTGVINKFTPEGEKSIFASGISNPGGMHFDSQDNMILAYENGVMRITPDGNREVIYSGDGNYMTGDENDNFYLGNWTTGRLYKLVDGVRTFIADLNANINGLDYYNGYIYIAGVETSQIFKVDAITGEIEILAGTRTDQVIDGPIATADFDAPNDIAVSPDGQSIYVIERDTGDLRKISIE